VWQALTVEEGASTTEAEPAQTTETPEQPATTEDAAAPQTVAAEAAGAEEAPAKVKTGNESAPIQLAQCRFPGLAISNAKILTYFSNKNIQKQFYQTAPGNCYGFTFPKC